MPQGGTEGFKQESDLFRLIFELDEFDCPIEAELRRSIVETGYSMNMVLKFFDLW